MATGLGYIKDGRRPRRYRYKGEINEENAANYAPWIFLCWLLPCPRPCVICFMCLISCISHFPPSPLSPGPRHLPIHPFTPLRDIPPFLLTPPHGQSVSILYFAIISHRAYLYSSGLAAHGVRMRGGKLPYYTTGPGTHRMAQSPRR